MTNNQYYTIISAVLSYVEDAYLKGRIQPDAIVPTIFEMVTSALAEAGSHTWN